MAPKSKPDSRAPRRLSFGAIARIMRWAPFDFAGFQGSWFPTPRIPVLLTHGKKNAADACKTLNHRLSRHSLAPRFGWLPARTFKRHEQLDIETSIREAQRGELLGDVAGNVHLVAKQAATLGESLSRTGEVFYVFFRFFPNVHGPFPLERLVVLPDEEIGAAIEAESQRWASKNKSVIAKQLRRLKKQSARRTGGPPSRPEQAISVADLFLFTKIEDVEDSCGAKEVSERVATDSPVLKTRGPDQPLDADTDAGNGFSKPIPMKNLREALGICHNSLKKRLTNSTTAVAGMIRFRGGPRARKIECAVADISDGAREKLKHYLPAKSP